MIMIVMMIMMMIMMMNSVSLHCLLVAGADPNLVTAASGNTALHAATEVCLNILNTFPLLTSPVPKPTPK